MTAIPKHLFTPLTLAGQTVKNRIAMAPLTRQMAEEDGTPIDEMTAYYARRARGGFGMIITEGTYEEDKLGCRAYLSQPGVANRKHVKAWKNVSKAIHAHGSTAILQLMHGGRVSDPRVLDGKPPVSASATQSGGWTLYTDTDYERDIRNIKNKKWPKVTFSKSRALTGKELHKVADGFADGAARAVQAGFDGVEIHGANGYLLWQFINPKANFREDKFGGSAENNVRFARRFARPLARTRSLHSAFRRMVLTILSAPGRAALSMRVMLALHFAALKLMRFTGRALAGAITAIPCRTCQCRKSFAMLQA